MNCNSQSEFIKISNTIYKRALKNNTNNEFKKSARLDNEIRKEIIRKGKISFLDNSEPLFILEGYDLETGEYYTEIWNSKGFMSYNRYKKDYKENKENLYTENLKLLIKTWNTEKIEQEMIEKGIDFGGLAISATVIYFSKNGKINDIKSFSFSQYEGCLKEIIEYE